MHIISKIVVSIRRVLEFILAAGRGGRGFNSLFIRTIQLFRNDGWQAIKERLYFILQSEGLPAAITEEGHCGDRNDYSKWIQRFDDLTDDIRNRMRKKIETFVHQPLISVLMPTYNPNPIWLKEAIGSVQNQIYQNWELCIADDASTIETINPILEEYAKKDPRIKVVFKNENDHISASYNRALENATGEYIALLDQNDLLSEHALYWVVDKINSCQKSQLIYSDEDKIDKNRNRFDHYFKCDWNQDLFYSQNIICHLGVFKRDLVLDLGGFREGFESAQDYDLALRCIERIGEQQVAHIPRVLYHSRQNSESISIAYGTKPHTSNAGQRALNEHFERIGVKCVVEGLDFGMYRARYALPEKLPLVSLIIPTRNGQRLLQQCIESILIKTSYPNYEIIIVDNASDDPDTLNYFQDLKGNGRIYVVRDERPFNFSALNNAAVKTARGELVGLINDDIEVISKDWLSEMVSLSLQPKAGAIGARLWYPKETLQHGGIITGIGGTAGHSHRHLKRGLQGYNCRANLIQGMSAVTGACLLIKKEIYEEVGGLNDSDLQVAFNDVDFCLRVREAGYRNIWTPYADLYHHESATRGYEDEDDPEKWDRFMKEKEFMIKQWGDILKNDRAYSPNLTLYYEDFTLAWPPRIDLL